MDVQTVSENCVALFLRGGSSITKDQAEQLVRAQLQKNLLKPWRGIHIDLFCAGADALVIAFPSEQLRISIADYAIEYINRYFTN